jgi:hypothetical protein
MNKTMESKTHRGRGRRLIPILVMLILFVISGCGSGSEGPLACAPLDAYPWTGGDVPPSLLVRQFRYDQYPIPVYVDPAVTLSPDIVSAAICYWSDFYGRELFRQVSDATGLDHQSAGIVIIPGGDPTSGIWTGTFGSIQVNAIDVYTPEFLVQLLSHEFGHTLGYGHSSIEGCLMFSDHPAMGLAPIAGCQYDDYEF